MFMRRVSGFEVDFNRLDQRHQPGQQLLVHGMIVIRFVAGSIGELHDASELVTLRAGRDVGSDERLLKTGNLPLQVLDLLNSTLFLSFLNSWFPTKEKCMDDHTV
jgi:hypothetical protein